MFSAGKTARFPAINFRLSPHNGSRPEPIDSGLLFHFSPIGERSHRAACTVTALAIKVPCWEASSRTVSWLGRTMPSPRNSA